MCLLLISFGFSPEDVYFKMKTAEFYCHFLTAMKLVIRSHQMASSTFISSVGTFLIKKGEKTIFEDLSEGLKEIEDIMGDVQERIEKDIVDNSAFDNLLFQMNISPAARKR